MSLMYTSTWVLWPNSYGRITDLFFAKTQVTKWMRMKMTSRIRNNELKKMKWKVYLLDYFSRTSFRWFTFKLQIIMLISKWGNELDFESKELFAWTVKKHFCFLAWFLGGKKLRKVSDKMYLFDKIKLISHFCFDRKKAYKGRTKNV